uniref:Uncharacterized protein n=1 Tax=Panagrolaimus sp. JU765 TaxID=591449 RepID=A0AC34PZ31_9BILA
MNSKNQIEHARGILRYFSDTKKEEFPDLEELGNAFGLLARFVVLSKDEETFKITVELLKELLEESGPLMSGILDHDLVAVKDYVWSVDCGHLVNMQNIGIQSDSDRSRRLYEPMRRRRDRNHEPSIPASEIPKLHQMFYGFVQKCFNVLDLLVLEMKAAGVISYCLGKTDPWMFVVDLCKIQNRPEFDSIDANNARILKNWCSLVRSTIVGSFFVLKNLDNEKKAQFFPILMNFALEHCDDCLMLNRTLESLKEDTCCEDLLLIQETIKLTLCRCISQGVVHVFYFIQKQTGSHFDDVDLKSRILDCIRRILFSLDLDSSFEFLTSILKLVTANAEHHCRETCPNSFLFDIFSEVHSMLKSDRSNWLKFIESCLADLPPGFCGCIPPQSLFFRLWFPVYGDELKAMKKLILKQFEEDFADDWEKKPVEIWKVDFGLGNWLKDSHFCDWKDMVEIIEVMNDILDEITKAEVIKILVNFYLANDDEDLREILLIFFFRQLNSEEMSNQI